MFHQIDGFLVDKGTKEAVIGATVVATGPALQGQQAEITDESGAREETTVKIAPTPGKLVLFPSWLMHGVKPHRGPRERISIAVNVLALPLRPA